MPARPPAPDPSAPDPAELPFGRGRDRTAELPLPGPDSRLPWLEGEEEEERGRNRGVLIALALAVLLVVALLATLGVLWLRHHRAGAPVADGSLIAAPPGPYKVRPANPGGEVAAGTGDTSFAVAEGRVRQVRLGEGSDEIVGAGTGPQASGGASAGPASTGRVAVQLGAYASAAEAEADWPKLVARAPTLSRFGHRAVAGSADIGQVYGLQAITPDRPSAQALCTELRAVGVACRIKG